MKVMQKQIKLNDIQQFQSENCGKECHKKRGKDYQVKNKGMDYQEVMLEA